MALAINMLQPTGITAGYWAISTLTIRLRTQTAEIGVAGWTSREAYDAGYEPVAGQLVNVTADQFASVFPAEQAAGIIGSLYAYLLTCDAWAAAEVVE